MKRKWVVVIVLVSAVLASVIYFYFATPDARKVRARVAVKTLAQKVALYKVDNGKFPDDIKELTEPRSDGSLPYLPAESAIDPWGQPYQLEVDNGDRATVFTSYRGERISAEVEDSGKP